MSDLFPIDLSLYDQNKSQIGIKNECQIRNTNESQIGIKNESQIRNMNESQNKETKEEEIISLPKLNYCKRFRSHSSGFFSCQDIFKEIDYKVSHSNIHKIISQLNCKNIQCKKLCPDLSWNSKSESWDKYPVINQNMYMVSVKDLKEFLLHIVNRMRKNKEDKILLLKKFNIHLTEEETNNIKVPIENHLISLLYKCCPFSIETSYKLGNHIIDAFIPRLRLAIMIDEHGHKNYDFNEEKDYDTLIRDNNMVLFRFNPNEQYLFDVESELIRKIWSLTLSPEMKAFIRQNV
jgi:hypothetical protein